MAALITEGGTLLKNLPKSPDGLAASPFSLPGILALYFTQLRATSLRIRTRAL